MQQRRWLAMIALVSCIGDGRSGMLRQHAAPAPPTPATARPPATAPPTSSAASRSPRATPINLGTLLVTSGADQRSASDSQNGVELAIDHLDGEFDQTDGQILGHDVDADERGRPLLRGGRAGGRHGARGRRVDRRRDRHQLLQRRAGRRRHDPVRQGHPAVLAVEHEPGADGGGHAPAVLRAHRAQRPDPGRDRVRASCSRSWGSRRPPRSPTRARTPRGSWRRSRSNFEAAGGTITGTEQVDSEDDTTSSRCSRHSPRATRRCCTCRSSSPRARCLTKQAEQIMPDTRIMVGSDGCLAADTLKNAGAAGRRRACVLARTSRRSRATPSTRTSSSPRTRTSFGSAPRRSSTRTRSTPMNVLVEAIEAVAIDNGDGSLSIPTHGAP